MRGFPHCRMVELKLPAANNTVTQFSFPDQPDLRYARVLAIEVFTATDIAQTLPSYYPVITDAQMSKLFLTLETNDPDDLQGKGGKDGRFTSTQQNIKYVPFASFHRVQNSATAPFVRQLMEFDNLYVTWQKSFVSVVNGGLLNNTDVGVALMVYYSWLNKSGQPINRT